MPPPQCQRWGRDRDAGPETATNGAARVYSARLTAGPVGRQGASVSSPARKEALSAMLKRLARPLLPLIFLGALAFGAFPSAAGAVTVGISDNSPAMFSSPLFLKLNIATARDIVIWDAAVLKNKSALN